MRKIKKNKSNNYMLIGIIYVVMLLTISTAYSFLNEDLSINTSASISLDGNNYIIDNTIISKEEIDGIYYYDYDIVLTYTGEEVTTGWEIYIQIPFDSEITECYNASSCVVEGETLTITNDSTNGILSPNNTSTTLSFKFKTSNPDYIFNVLGTNFLTEYNATELDITNDSNNLNLYTIETSNKLLTILYDWGTTKEYLFTVNNITDTTIQSWTAKIYIPNSYTINTISNATWSYDATTNILTMSGSELDSMIPQSTNLEININVTTSTEEEIYVIDFIGINENGEEVCIDATGNLVVKK